jgi:hypothetical protein
VEQNEFYCGYDCDTMVNNVFAFGLNGKVFFAAVNFPGSLADGSLTARFLYQMKRRIGRFKTVLIRAFLGAGMILERSLGLCQKGMHGAFTMTYATICYR